MTLGCFLSLFSLNFKILYEKIQTENLQNNQIQTRQYFHAVCCFEKKHHMNVDDIFSLILITCNIILKRKAKCNHAIYKHFRYYIFTFCFFLYCGYFTCWSVMSTLKFYKCSIFCLIKKLHIAIACCTCYKKCWFSAALLTSH